MNKERILLKLSLDAIDLGGLGLDEFTERLELQKKMYLLQLTGFDLGYRYNWYLRGPYCPSLAEEAFILKGEIETGETDYEEFQLSSESSNKVKVANEIWASIPESESKQTTWLEMLASMHYLKHIAYWPGKTGDKAELFEKLKNTKPGLAEEPALMELAWNRLDEKGLLQCKTLG